MHPHIIPLDELDEPVEGPRKPGLIEVLGSEFKDGKSLVPLVGAGLSAPSGIPVTAELEKYLALCVAMALGLDEQTRKIAKRWHPTANGWPEFRGDWLSRSDQAQKCIAGAVHETEGDPKKIAEHRILREAYGDLVDWRLALLFLSRISLPTEREEEGNEISNRVQLIDSDSHVIDSFFNHITAGKVPSMGHRILAEIAGSLRAQVTLSLNFDSLLEQSFDEAGLSPKVFEVHQAAGLPPRSDLGQRHSIIKLHGGKYGVRADLTLDRGPSESERHQFRGYLLGRDWTVKDEQRARQLGAEKPRALANLLVAGVSGRDRRVLLFIKDALDHLSSFRVIWIGWSEEGLDEAISACRAVFGEDDSRVMFLQHPHLGTLFWEVYQRLMNCVPSSGLEFPSSWQIPLVPEAPKAERDEIPNKDADERANSWLSRSETKIPLILESGVDPNCEWGVSAFAWGLFRRSIGSHNSIWLDGEDLATPEDIRERLFQAVCAQIGENHQLPPLQKVEDDEYFDDLDLHALKSGRPWVMFLNLRGFLGYSANPFHRLTAQEPTNWIEEDINQARTCEIISKLCRRRSRRFKVVLLRRQGQFPQIPGTNETIINFKLKVKAPNVDSWAIERVEIAKKWADSTPGEEEMRWRLLRAVGVFPLVRHSTALVSRSVARLPFEGSWGMVWRDVDVAIRYLVRQKVLRRKPGGFLWMHWQVREEFRNLFEGDAQLRHTTEDDRIDIHTGLADWSMTLFRATHDPQAAFQAIFHRCRAAQLAWNRAETSDKNRLVDLVRMRSSLCEALNHLETARASILAWGNKLDAERCLFGVTNLLLALTSSSKNNHPESQRNRRFLLLACARLHIYQIWFYRDLGDYESVIGLCERLGEILGNSDDELGNLSAQFSQEWPTEHYCIGLQRQLELAVAYISLRNYNAANRRLSESAKALGFPLEEIISSRCDRDVELLLLKWAHEDGGSDSSKQRYERRRFLTGVLRRLMETFLLEFEAGSLLSLSTSHTGNESHQNGLLDKAQRIYIAARMLTRFVIEDEYSPTRIERSRLHSVMAGVLICRGDEEGVQRHINEAWSAASHLPESEEFIAKSVVELRKVYFLLQKVKELKCIRPYAEWMMNNFGREERLTSVTSEHIVSIMALLEDSRVILDRVESRMSRNRKSLWWWMTLRRYKMVTLQYFELVRLLKRSYPELRKGIESLDGLNLASFEDGTTGRILLAETARRVSSDEFQMARITHNAINLARLSLLTNCDGSSRSTKGIWKAEKQMWRECVQSVLLKLNALREKRETAGTETNIDLNVKSYIDHVLNQASEFVALE